MRDSTDTYPWLLLQASLDENDAVRPRLLGRAADRLADAEKESEAQERNKYAIEELERLTAEHDSEGNTAFHLEWVKGIGTHCPVSSTTRAVIMTTRPHSEATVRRAWVLALPKSLGIFAPRPLSNNSELPFSHVLSSPIRSLIVL